MRISPQHFFLGGLFIQNISSGSFYSRQENWSQIIMSQFLSFFVLTAIQKFPTSFCTRHLGSSSEPGLFWRAHPVPFFLSLLFFLFCLFSWFAVTDMGIQSPQSNMESPHPPGSSERRGHPPPRGEVSPAASWSRLPNPPSSSIFHEEPDGAFLERGGQGDPILASIS